MILCFTLPVSAQRSDGFFNNYNNDYDNRTDGIAIGDDGIGHWGIGETVPIGNGLLILTAIGAGYAIMRRKSYKAYKTHTTCKSFISGATLFLALTLFLGMTSCKKKVVETITPTPTNGVNITLNVDGNNSKVIVDPTNGGANNYASVAFEDGDIIYVGYNNAYVGTLTYSDGTFSGNVNIDTPVGEKPLHFYFLGGKGFTPTIDGNTATVVISDQTSRYPVISYAPSKQVYTGEGSYSAKLQNKCSIMKFNVTTPSTAPICITGMNNKVTVNFASPSDSDNGFSYSVNSEDGGLIKMPAKDGDNVTWAIVLPQSALSAGVESTAYTADNFYKGSRPAIAAITANQYINAGKALTINTLTQLGTPLTLEAKTAGTIAIANPKSGMKYTLNGGTKTQVPTSITVAAGDIVQLYGNGTSITIYGNDTPSKSTMITGGTADCYIYGNIMSLVDETGVGTATTLARLSFGYLFKNNTHLVNHPTKSLLLPAENLAYICYYSIFYGCTGLTSAPELPATNLYQDCYNSMFKGCTSLTKSPLLAAETLTGMCYYQMFQGCSNLSSVTCLATNISATNCTTNWLDGVAASGTFYINTSLDPADPTTGDEWTYVFNTRASGSTVNSTDNARYTFATINTDGTSVYGLVLFPDGVTIVTDEATSWGDVNTPSDSWSNSTQCTTAQWNALAIKGCVFLPYAGYRSGTTVTLNSRGDYRSSTSDSSTYAYYVRFYPGTLVPKRSFYRSSGYSVRLVYDAN